MEQTLADLLSDAFAETYDPSLPDGDLDFENLNFDEDKTSPSHENVLTKEDEVLHQEANGQTAVFSAVETADTYVAENVDEEQSDEEDFQGVGVMSTDKIPEEGYTSSDADSEQEGSASGDDKEDEEEDMGIGVIPEGLSASEEFCDGNKEDRIFAEGQPLALEGAENPQVRNEEQGESRSDEEVFYFERVPEQGGEMPVKGEGSEEDELEREDEKQEHSSDSELESMKIEQEDGALAQCFEQEAENPCSDSPAGASLNFPEISVQNLQDLLAEVDGEDYVEKMKDFSGEEHQEAGESYADYPSDFSPGEYEDAGGRNQDSSQQLIASQSTCPERPVTGIEWMARAEDSPDDEEYLYSVNLEEDADQFRCQDVATGEKHSRVIQTVECMLGDMHETDESESYSSSEDEARVMRSDEEPVETVGLQDSEDNKKLEESRGRSDLARWSTSDDSSRGDFSVNWNLDIFTAKSILCEDLLTTEDTDKAETLLSDVIPAEDVTSYFAVQRVQATSPSNQGSLDDSFFFNTDPEASVSSEVGQLGDDEYEDDRNWEQEQERIKAFNEFYADSDGESGREGRQIKVQFCTDPLSQVIHYESDSSYRDSLSSSTDGEEDLSSADTSEELKEPDDTMQMKPVPESQNTQPPEKMPDLCSTQNHTRKHKCLHMLKLSLTMGVMVVMGLLMFCFVTDQADWLSQVLFY